MVIREKEQIEIESYIKEEIPLDIYTDLKQDNFNEKLTYLFKAEKEAIRIGSETYKIVFKSKSQEHSFNFPYQIGTNGDSPTKADSNTIPLLPNDIVILGSDGLFDNLYDHQILQIVESLGNRQNGVEQENSEESRNLNRDANLAQNIADGLARKAFDQSLNEKFFAPFGLNALLKVGSFFMGGKSDDITVVVGQVEIEEPKAESV